MPELTGKRSESCLRKISFFQIGWSRQLNIQHVLKSKLGRCIIGLVMLGLMYTMVLHDNSWSIVIPAKSSVVKEQDEPMYSYHEEVNIDGKLREITDNCTRSLPQCIIIGVMKGGTEAFSKFLGLHPRVAMQVAMVSTQFFAENYNQGFEWYRQMMPCARDDQITIEKAPQYYPSQNAIQRIYQFNPAIKLILLVRNPIDRAVSHFLQQKNQSPQRLDGDTFEENIMCENGSLNTDSVYIRQSSYIVILQEWLSYFTLDQILIVDGDNFRRNAVMELSRTERFLNVEPYIKESMFVYNQDRNIYCIAARKEEGLCLSDGKAREHPHIQPDVYEKLQAYFKPLNQQFMETVGMHFDW